MEAEKSTILHAIASIYMPEEGFPGEDHRLMHFFPRSPHAEWNGSDFIVNLTYRKDGVMIENELKKIMEKQIFEAHDGFRFMLVVL
ncbi:hypothetical protein ACP0HM_36020 [Escherichia coli]